MISTLQTVGAALRERGPGYLWPLATRHWIPSLFQRAASGRWRSRLRRLALLLALPPLGLAGWGAVHQWGWIPSLLGAAALGVGALFGRPIQRRREFNRLELHATRLTTAHPSPREAFVQWAGFPVSAETRRRVDDALRTQGGTSLDLGHIDDDGRVVGLHGELPGLPNIRKEEFVPRKRFDLSIVLQEGCVLVRKDYRGNREGFLGEWATLVHLAGKVNVPALHHVDVARTRLFKNLILGETLREHLVAAGARILRVDTNTDPELAHLTEAERIEAVWARAQAYLPRCLTPEALAGMERQVEAAHAAGVTGVSFTYGNVIVDATTGLPWFIDLDKARIHQNVRSLGFQLHRDRERDRFNKLYGRSLLTEAGARQLVKEWVRESHGSPEPLDLGAGLVAGPFWTTRSGMGLWEAVQGPLLRPLIEGKRILNLNPRNGTTSILMLRDGALEVRGLARTRAQALQAERTRRLFEWRDQRPYTFVSSPEPPTASYDIALLLDPGAELTAEERDSLLAAAGSLAPLLVIGCGGTERPPSGVPGPDLSTRGFRVRPLPGPALTPPLLVAERIDRAGAA
ncbi:MAG TPA: hypothetical protein DCM86_10045 [Verrucomicrobiales bacterium]|nr:hypothetical protein [Verrucomicrobiales bacterium]